MALPRRQTVRARAKGDSEAAVARVDGAYAPARAALADDDRGLHKPAAALPYAGACAADLAGDTGACGGEDGSRGRPGETCCRGEQDGRCDLCHGDMLTHVDASDEAPTCCIHYSFVPPLEPSDSEVVVLLRQWRALAQEGDGPVVRVVPGPRSPVAGEHLDVVPDEKAAEQRIGLGLVG